MEMVYCTECRYFRLCDEGLPYCGFESHCDINDYEDGKSRSERPHHDFLKLEYEGKPLTIVDADDKFDIVDNPKHYTNKEIEPIDYMQDTLTPDGFEGYCIGNVLKYVSRYQNKNGVQDLKKARWYLNRVIEYYE